MKTPSATAPMTNVPRACSRSVGIDICNSGRRDSFPDAAITACPAVRRFGNNGGSRVGEGRGLSFYRSDLRETREADAQAVLHVGVAAIRAGPGDRVAGP